MNIKTIFSHNFRHFYGLFFLPLFVCYWKNCFACFFPPIFRSRYSCEYKIQFFRTFCDDFFPFFFARTIGVFVKNCFARIIHRIFWSRYSYEYKKRSFALVFDDFFSFLFCTISLFLEKLFRAFFPLFLITIFV